jgi:hypothetical protein
MVFIVNDEHDSPRDLREAKLRGLRAEHEARANWERPDGQDEKPDPNRARAVRRTTAF